MAAMAGIRDGKGFYGKVEADGGRQFVILKILNDASKLEGKFAGDHVEQVKAAFVQWGLPYPGDSIADCVAALLRA